MASNLITRNVGDILLIDVIEGLPQGEALDLGHLAASYGVDVALRGTNDYKDIEGSDVVIVTAGLPRRPGMTRLDLLTKNVKIVRDISRNIVEYAPESKVLMVTNPLDVMTYVALKVTGFPSGRVFGMGGLLDSARFRYFISEALNISRSSVQALVIGQHGESMLPLSKYSTVSGKPLTDVMSRRDIEVVVEKTRKTAAEVIALKGGTVHAPGDAVGKMVEAIVRDKKEVLPVSAYLNGEYGVKDLCIGVPAVLGKEGVEGVKELRLEEGEEVIFMRGVETLKKVISETVYTS